MIFFLVGIMSSKIDYRLDCTEECKVIERNRRLAVGLQIRNPDLSAKLTPKYSDSLRAWAKKDPNFCQMVHDRLTDLVQLARQVWDICRHDQILIFFFFSRSKNLVVILLTR